MSNQSEIDFTFTSWEGRPTILFRTDGGELKALSILKPGDSWTSVDASDVAHSAAVISGESAFKRRFVKRFGAIKLPNEYKPKKPFFDYEEVNEKVEQYFRTPDGQAEKKKYLAKIEDSNSHRSKFLSDRSDFKKKITNVIGNFGWSGVLQIIRWVGAIVVTLGSLWGFWMLSELHAERLLGLPLRQYDYEFDEKVDTAFGAFLQNIFIVVSIRIGCATYNFSLCKGVSRATDKLIAVFVLSYGFYVIPSSYFSSYMSSLMGDWYYWFDILYVIVACVLFYSYFYKLPRREEA